MAPFNCCGFRRNTSPNPQPIRLVDNAQRFALSSHSLTPTETAPEAAPTQNIFASASEDNGQINSSATSGQDLLPLHETEADMHRRHSSRKLWGVASHVRKRMSRDSGMSRRSSRRALRTSMSLEDTDRRAELKRALHRRVKDSLYDSTTDDDHYDDDAVPIKTPKSTWGRQQGSIQVDSEHINKVLSRSESLSRLPHIEHHQREISEGYATNPAATTLSRMLTQRASSLSENPESRNVKAADETPRRSQSKKYVFEDEETPKPATHTRSRSPLERSSNMVRAESGFKQVELGLLNPPLLLPTGAPPPPELLPSRMPSISKTPAEDQWRLPAPERAADNLAATSNPKRRPPPANALLSGIYDTKIRPASESWLHGASGLLGPSRHAKGTSSDHITGQMAHHGHDCDPGSEEADFGGIDGRDDSPPASIYHTARTRNHSEGDEPSGSTHIYNMHVPSRLASKLRLPSVSLPQLQAPRRQRSFASGGSEAFSVKSRRQPSSASYINPNNRASSSGFPSPPVSTAWDNPQWRASSSVYSSQPESLLSSQQSSLRRIARLHDRLQQIKAYAPSDEIISVPASRPKSIDLDKFEQQISDGSYQSSSESLLQRELAAAETRIAPLPRANTLPKNSRFKEELDRISAEIALTNPVRRRVSNLDGGNEWNRASQAITDKHATSIWERALREHSQEDAALTHTRLGSDSRVGPMDLPNNGKPVSARKAPTRPPLERSNKGMSLQERLASYKLPTPVKAPIKTPDTQETQRSASIHSTSSWTRYPSHTRFERSMSPAGEQDQVFTRDFASSLPTTPSGNSPTKHHFHHHGTHKESQTFGQHMLSSIKHIYRTQSQELQRRLANEARGNRSSISQGGVLEYPELEMLGAGSPVLMEPDGDGREVWEEAIRRVSQTGAQKVGRWDLEKGGEARRWSRVYEECCVVRSPQAGKVRGVSGGSGEEGGRKGGGGDGSGSGSGSSGLRGSTLDFKRSLEVDEGRERERVLGMGMGVGGAGGGG